MKQFTGLVIARGMLARLCVAACALGASVAALAVERTLKLEAPAHLRSGEDFTVTLSATTDAGGGEQVGFLQADVSLDNGKTWAGLCYLDKSGPRVTRQVNLKAGAPDSQVRVRVRVAFRDGLAGDVDYTGAAIRWQGSWDAWEMPPSRQAVIPVGAR